MSGWQSRRCSPSSAAGWPESARSAGRPLRFAPPRAVPEALPRRMKVERAASHRELPGEQCRRHASQLEGDAVRVAVAPVLRGNRFPPTNERPVKAVRGLDHLEVRGDAVRVTACVCCDDLPPTRRSFSRARWNHGTLPQSGIWLAYKGERRDSNPRPPGPQPDRSTSRGLCHAWLRDAGCSQFAQITLVWNHE